MSEHETAGRVVATPAAREAIKVLRAAAGAVIFVQSAGCCDGSVPMCYPAGHFITGPDDVLLGEVEGCPFMMSGRLYETFGQPRFVLDVQPGPAPGFSLPAGEGLRFVTRDIAPDGDHTPPNTTT